MNSYDILAPYYEILAENVDYGIWFDYLKKLSGLSELKAKKVLDLGCGTGELLGFFAREKSIVTGVDSSVGMLSICDSLLFKEHLHANLVHKSMQEFKTELSFDFIYSSCDSINYLDEVQLEQLLKNVCVYLKEGSFFTFDIINPEYFKKICRDSEIIEYKTGKLSIRREIKNSLFITHVEIDEHEKIENVDFVQYAINEATLKKVIGNKPLTLVGYYDFLTEKELNKATEKIQIKIIKNC